MKLCRNCVHRGAMGDYCTAPEAPRDVVYGWPAQLCVLARGPNGGCGPDAAWFEAKPEPVYELPAPVVTPPKQASWLDRLKALRK